MGDAPDGRMAAEIVLVLKRGMPRTCVIFSEESPGSDGTGWRVTPAHGDVRESATEKIPLGFFNPSKGEKVR